MTAVLDRSEDVKAHGGSWSWLGHGLGLWLRQVGKRWLFSESCASCLGRVLSAVLTLISITCTVSQGCESFCHMLLPRASLLWMHQPARCHQMA